MTSTPGADGDPTPLLERLEPSGAPETVAQVVESFGLWERAGEPPMRPRVLLNMASTLDGRASLGGRSGPISGPADRALFHALRAAVDGVLVGAATVRAERYGRMVRDQATRRLRSERGLAEEPLACIVSGRLVLDPELPLLREPAAHVVVLTASGASLPEAEARVDYVRAATGETVDLESALVELTGRFAVGTLLCEGGPHLARQLLGAGLIDELFLCVSPLLAGGEPVEGGALRVFAGLELDPPAHVELRSALCADSYLFLRYAVSAPARVSRATTSSSSLAS
jgi:riboflavin-specific deaminase-like protein